MTSADVSTIPLAHTCHVAPGKRPRCGSVCIAAACGGLNPAVPGNEARAGQVNLRSQRGMANSVFTVVALPFMLLVLGLMLYFGRWLYVYAAMHDAAAAGARWAATSLSGSQGCAQAKSAMLEVVSRHNLNRSGARVSVTPVYVWGRGYEAEVSVAYRFVNRDAWIVGPLFGDSTASSRYVVVIDEFNNRYANGWVPCR